MIASWLNRLTCAAGLLAICITTIGAADDLLPSWMVLQSRPSSTS